MYIEGAGSLESELKARSPLLNRAWSGFQSTIPFSTTWNIRSNRFLPPMFPSFSRGHSPRVTRHGQRPLFTADETLRNPINNRRLTVANCLPRVNGCTIGTSSFFVRRTERFHGLPLLASFDFRARFSPRPSFVYIYRWGLIDKETFS